jgi:O-antigen/teichoic acid export membrane protein
MLRSFLSQWLGFAVTGILSIILTPILVHGMGSFYYGMWILVASLLDYCGLLDLGMRYTLQRFAGRYYGMDRAALNETLATALASTVAIGGLLCALSFLFASLLPGFFGLTGTSRPLFQELLVLEGLSVAVFFPARLLGAYLCGLQRFDFYNLGQVATGVLRAVLFVLVLHFGLGVLGIVAVGLGIAILTLALNWRLVRWADPALSLHWRLASWSRLRDLAHFGVYVFLSSVGDQLRFYTASIIIARFLAVALTTPFNVVTRLIEYYKLVFYPITGPLTTSMSALDGQAREQDLQRLFLRSSKLTALLGMLGGVLLLLHGKAVLRLWVGKSFESSYVLLVILTIGYIVTLGQLPSQTILYARGRHRALALWTLAEGVANLGLSIYWATHHGLVERAVGPALSPDYCGLAGVALGTAVPMLAVRTLIQPWYVLRVAKVAPSEYFMEVLVRPALACGPFVVIGVLAEAPWMGSSLMHLTATVVWQTALFGALAYTLALGRSDRQLIRARIGNLVSSLGSRRQTVRGRDEGLGPTAA